ncbi:T9SS type A sorting domain-containing protein [Fluviicola sp.]|uniref:T9SS type A sorting domain-containing protein n=1 Tax=Fluviicola sp. TaxID=1917219 RepID=UPI0026287CC3|nr:T9SS type A sorting domain-containing protein [Fluviicola sp.]
MKKLLLTLLTFSAVGFHFHSDAQCTVSISATDSLICAGDTPVLTATTIGEGHTLGASNFAGNDHRGNMFDIVATNSVIITSFDASPMQNTTIEIYYKAGTWNGFANSPSSWTFVGSAPVIATGGIVPVAVPVNVTIPAGETYAFYVTSNNTNVSVNYSNGTNIGNVYSSDANITFLEGGGMEYPFTAGTGAVYQPRVWNGNIHYALANQPTLTFLWSQGQTNDSITPTISATTQFTVESTVQGCPTMYDTLTINLSIPFVNAGNDSAVCIGDSVTLNATGPFDYSWNNSVINDQTFLPLNPATYIVTATDSAGCTATDTVFINIHSLPNVSAGTGQTICQGSSFTLSGSGASTYVWNNNVTNGVPFVPNETNTYSVVGTDTNGCQNSDTITVTIHEYEYSITVSGEIILIGNPGAGVTYQWMNCTTNQLIPGQTDQAYLVTENGSYAVIVSDGFCTDTTNCLTVNTVGLSENTANDLISVYPNPNNGTFTIQGGADSEVEISDLNGRIVKRVHLTDATTEIELSHEKNGIYFVKCIKEDLFTIKRIIIQKN